ncbi:MULTISPECIES: hypothetical protein [unclassified Spirosoma]|uniref:hypothetical protein n=1 Tax=unclassified Spirosoma TaxID=2621999 RepID=UPI00096590CB|nr:MULTISPECIES: hypothetical protein [unclassified Spirosoma]MBN8824445.1 hypothetical protein [Spirosoma sp.]OJW70092.1 MAG: hypothetical protein BGO59_25800 [Spirosoma sp. 48-14]
MLSFQDLLPYLQQGAGRNRPGSKLLHKFYGKSILHRDEIEQVFGDAYPKYLDKDRPRELPEHKKYRKEVYENVFRGFKSRVISALDYIRQADDFDVQWPTTDIQEVDSLQTYTGKGFSAEGDFVEWFFSNVKSDYVDDPNAVLLLLPVEQPLSDAEYPRPQAMIIPCQDVWMFRRGKFAVLVAPEKTMLPGDTPDEPTGNVLYFLDHDSYTIARQTGLSTNQNGQRIADWQILGMENLYDLEGNLQGQLFNPPRHYCSTMPARKIGLKRIKKTPKGEEYYESLIADALPHIRLGQRNQSDIQVETNFHVASKEWRRSTSKCKQPGCTGGVIHIRDDVKGTKSGEPGAIIDVRECPTCKGTGFHDTGSGLNIMYVDASDGTTPGDLRNVPSGDPGGFIKRPIESLKTFVEEFKRNCEEAYTTIDMQFIRKTPYDESGASKRYDRQEMLRTLVVNGVHIVDLMSFGYECIDAQRFGASGRLGEQLPEVLAPVRLDLENAELTREELNNAKDKKYDPTLVQAYEKKMLLYTTGEQSDEYRRYVLRTQCDPYLDVTEEMKAYLLGVAFRNPDSPENRAKIERIYLSLDFDGLVADALREDADFWQKSLTEQYNEIVRRGKALVGPQTVGLAATGGAGGGAFPTIDPLSLKPPVDVQQIEQTQQKQFN